MTLDVNGEICGCGKRGCWETFVGPRAVEHRVQRSLAAGAKSALYDMVKGDLKSIVIDDVLQAAQSGDQIAIDALNEVAFYLGIGIANLVNLFNVEVIVLGGALNKASSFLLKDIERVVSENYTRSRAGTSQNHSLSARYGRMRHGCNCPGTRRYITGA